VKCPLYFFCFYSLKLRLAFHNPGMSKDLGELVVVALKAVCTNTIVTLESLVLL
jgi:hypothetical protein